MWALLQLLYKGIDRELAHVPTVRPMTRTLIRKLVLDAPLSPAELTDFGVDSPNHYRALRQALETGMEATDMATFAQELDKGLGDGPALTALVQRYVPGCGVTFTTVWDTLSEFSESGE